MESWARVLDARVDSQGRVDYAGLAAAPGDLRQYIAWIADKGPGTEASPGVTRSQVLADHLNAYNALAMYSVLEAGVPLSLKDYGLVRFFWLRELRIGGRPLSLYAFEKRIRLLGDARVHFALNCMAAGCPRLPRRPFRAGTLEPDLDNQTRSFFAEERNLQVDHAARVVSLTDIMSFFPEDFLAEAPSLIAWINRHTGQGIPEHYTVRFIPYDWTVAAQPGNR